MIDIPHANEARANFKAKYSKHIEELTTKAVHSINNSTETSTTVSTSGYTSSVVTAVTAELQAHGYRVTVSYADGYKMDDQLYISW